jgi:hypothetical protein
MGRERPWSFFTGVDWPAVTRPGALDAGGGRETPVNPLQGLETRIPSPDITVE